MGRPSEDHIKHRGGSGHGEAGTPDDKKGGSSGELPRIEP